MEASSKTRTSLVLITGGTKRRRGHRSLKPCHGLICYPWRPQFPRDSHRRLRARRASRGAPRGEPVKREDLTMNANELMRVASAMGARGKGILAADESTGGTKRDCDSSKVETTEEHGPNYSR